jgi:3-deoxy-D-manno-octulosonate 8-phosphate phosphatase (KDO 8-P phosphatase)
VKKNISQKCKKIKLVLTDVDGVLTDGGRYFTKNGESMKKFHTRDGMGVNILLRNGIKTGIVTKENSQITKKWSKEMNVTKTFSGVIRKEMELPKICQIFNLNACEIAYIGDDVNDIELIKKVGLSAVPNDGINQVKKQSDYVCKLNGGEGAFREFSDLILSKKFPKKIQWY